MNIKTLLWYLRGRLDLVKGSIEERTEEYAHGDDEIALYANGALTELQEEEKFLTGLIADLEREGVTS